MEAVKENRERFIDGLHALTGIRKSAMAAYARENDILHILDHPMVIGVSDRQYQKIQQLKDFINSCRYLREKEAETRITIDGAKKAKGYFVSQLAFYREREVLLCAYFDNRMHLLSCEKISQGTVNASCVYPREVLKRVLQLDAAGIILAHNHPGCGIEPSKADIALTRTFHNIFKPLEIKVFDHIIVGDEKALSMNEEGILFTEFAYVTEEEYRTISFEKVAEARENTEYKEEKNVNGIRPQSEVEAIKEKYQPGMRVELEYMDERDMPPGLKGIIRKIDDQGQLHTVWENGRLLALVPGDKFKILEREEETEPESELEPERDSLEHEMER